MFRPRRHWVGYFICGGIALRILLEVQRNRTNNGTNIAPQKWKDMPNNSYIFKRGLQSKEGIRTVSQPGDEGDVRVYSMLASFYNSLDQLRLDLSSRPDQWKVENVTKQIVLNAKEETFFKKLEKFSNVKTLFAKISRQQLNDSLPPRCYHYASNDCDLLEKNSVAGSLRKEEHSTCLTKITLRNCSFTPLNVGLPRGYNHTKGLSIGYIHAIRGAVINQNADIYLAPAKIVIQRCKQDLRNEPIMQNVSKFPSYDEVFTIAQFWGFGYFHAVIEDLTRIALPFLLRHDSIKIHVYSKTGFTRVIMQYLGFPPNRLIAGKVYAKTLYSPAGSGCGHSSLMGTLTLSSILTKNIVPRIGPQDTIVLIKRSTKRYFRNHDSIFRMIQRVARDNSLKAVVFPDKPVPPFEEVTRLFNRALVIVAPHGAGLSNMVLSKPGTLIIEGLCYDVTHRPNLCYLTLAQILGHRYYGVMPAKDCFSVTPDYIKKPLLEYLKHR